MAELLQMRLKVNLDRELNMAEMLRRRLITDRDREKEGGE
jgi:hypothetical protein